MGPDKLKKLHSAPFLALLCFFLTCKLNLNKFSISCLLCAISVFLLQIFMFYLMCYLPFLCNYCDIC